MVSGRADEALTEVDIAVSDAPDPITTAKALMLRGLIRLQRGEPELALCDSEEPTAIAYQVGPALHSGILVMEAQARMACGDLDAAADQLAQADRTGADVDTTRLRDRYAYHCALARLRGRPVEALDYTAGAVDAWRERGSALHLLGNLAAAAELLAELEQDAEGVEMLGLVEACAVDIHGPGADPYTSLDEPRAVLAAEQRLGPEAADHRIKGLSVAAGMRATRATELIRIAQRTVLR
jgi:tetratricopeptide (TPR) repeat protein